MFPQRNCTSLHCYYFPIRVYCHVLFHTGLYLGFAAKMKNRFAKIQHFRKISVSRKYFPEMRNFRKNIFLENFIFAKFRFVFPQRFFHFREKNAKFHKKVCKIFVLFPTTLHSFSRKNCKISRKSFGKHFVRCKLQFCSAARNYAIINYI